MLIGIPGLLSPRPRYNASYLVRVYNTATANLLGLWPLGEPAGATVADNFQGLAARDGAYSAVTLGAAGFGDRVTAASFDGAASFVNVYSTSLRDAWAGGELSILLWFKASGAGVWTDSTARALVRFQVDAGNVVQLSKTAANNTLSWSYVAGSTSKGITSTAFANQNWQAMALTVSKSADQVKAYMNGVQVGATQTGLGTWNGNLASTGCVIGAQSTNPAGVWSGSIGYVAVWSAALTGAQITTLGTV